MYTFDPYFWLVITNKTVFAHFGMHFWCHDIL